MKGCDILKGDFKSIYKLFRLIKKSSNALMYICSQGNSISFLFTNSLGI